MSEEMTPHFDPSQFLAAESPVVVRHGKATKTKKSRSGPYNKPVDEDLAALRKKAESLCGSYEQFKIVKRYKKERLQDWVDEHEFDRDSAMRTTVFDFVHQGYTRALDFLTMGNGFVEERIKNDVALRTAIEDEGRDFVKYLSNKAKLIMLSVSDVSSAKLEQGLLRTKVPDIQEMHSNDDAEEGATSDNNSTTTWGFKNFLGGSGAAEEEPEDTSEILSVSEGEQNMQAAIEAISCDLEGQTACDDSSGEEGLRENTLDCEAIEE